MVAINNNSREEFSTLKVGMKWLLAFLLFTSFSLSPTPLLPKIGLSDVTGMVCDTVFINTVKERRIVTPEKRLKSLSR